MKYAFLSSVSSFIEKYPFLTNLFFFLSLAPLVFLRREHFMLNGLDGHYMHLLIANHFQWASLDGTLSFNPLQSLSNVFMGFNFKWIPAFSLPYLLFGETSNSLSYAIFSGELFIAAYLFGRICGFDKTISLLAGWILPVFSLWMLPWKGIYPFYGLTPQCVDLVLGTAIILASLKSLLDGSIIPRFSKILLIAATPIALAIGNPVMVILSAPVSIALASVILFTSSERRVFLWRLCSLLVALSAIIASGVIGFLYGNTFYSVTAFFADELIRVQNTFYNISIVFQQNPAGNLLFSAGVIGAAVAFRYSEQSIRKFALALLLFAMIIVFGGILMNSYADNYRGPQMGYFETSIWPLYSVYSAYLCVSIFRKLAHHLNFQAFTKPYALNSKLILLLLGCTTLFAGANQDVAASNPYILKPTPLTDMLKKEIGLEPGREFRGMAASITRMIDTKEQGLSWFDFHARDSEVIKKTGNDHRLVGLWKFGIPTLQEYNHFVTPSSYLLLSRLLSRPIDRQFRNITIMTQADNLNLLRALGVRFLITDFDMPSSAIKIHTLPVGEGESLFLYEITDINTGQYSPTRFLKVVDASAALEMISSSDLSSTTIVFEDVPTNLSPAIHGSLKFHKGRVHIRAKAGQDQSFLLLPLQYSHCWKVETGNARIIRANLMQTGVIFSGDQDIYLRFGNGIFQGDNCRLKDIDEMKRINLSEARHDFPLVPKK